MAGKRIVNWKKKDNNWNKKLYMEEHPDYKKKADLPVYVWETILYTAEEMGVSSEDMSVLFEKKPDISIVDLLFAMFLIRLYDRERAANFLSSGNMMSFDSLHHMLRDYEGFLIDQDKEVSEEDRKKLEASMKDMAAKAKEHTDAENLMLGMDNKLAHILEIVKEQTQKKGAEQKEDKQEPVKQAAKKTEEETKEFQQLQIDNQVLRYQLEHKEEVSKLQMQMQIGEKNNALKQAEASYKALLAEKDSALQQAKEKEDSQQKRIEELEKKIEECEKKDDQRFKDFQGLFEGYQVAIEANTRQMERLNPYRFFGLKKEISNAD